MSKSILVIGAGNFSFILIKQLYDMGHEIMVVDRNENKINALMPYVTDGMIGDCTNMNFLKSLGIPNYDVCVVTIGENFQNSLETTSLLKELGGKLIVSRADTNVQEKFLLRNGADYVVNPEAQMARWTAIRYTTDSILQYTTLEDELSIIEGKVPKSWVGKSIRELNIRKKYGLNIIAVKTEDVVSASIDIDQKLEGNQVLFLMGGNEEIKRYTTIH